MLMTCPDEFEVNPLYEAANLPGAKVRVPRADLDVVIACVSDGLKDTNEIEAGLNIGPHRTRPTVDKAALYALLVRHSRYHRTLLEGSKRIIRADAPVTLEAAPETRPEDSPAKPRSTGPADDLAAAFKDYLAPDPEGRFKLVAKANGIDPTKYAGRNFGLQRMALGNELRNRIKKGDAVTVGDKVIK